MGYWYHGRRGPYCWHRLGAVAVVMAALTKRRRAMIEDGTANLELPDNMRGLANELLALLRKYEISEFRGFDDETVYVVDGNGDQYAIWSNARLSQRDRAETHTISWSFGWAQGWSGDPIPKDHCPDWVVSDEFDRGFLQGEKESRRIIKDKPNV